MKMKEKDYMYFVYKKPRILASSFSKCSDFHYLEFLLSFLKVPQHSLLRLESKVF